MIYDDDEGRRQLLKETTYLGPFTIIIYNRSRL